MSAHDQEWIIATAVFACDFVTLYLNAARRAVQEAWIGDRVSLNEVWRYASLYRFTNEMRFYLERLVLIKVRKVGHVLPESCERSSTIKCPNDLLCRRYVASMKIFHHKVSDFGHFMVKPTPSRDALWT